MLTVVSTFADKHYDLYGRKFIETFAKHWENDVNLILYLDNADSPVYTAVNTFFEGGGRRGVKTLPLTAIPLLHNFIGAFRHTPNMNGKIHGGYTMHWDAIRFAYKVFVVAEAALKHNKNRYLLWLDADTVTHAPVSSKEMKALLNEGDVVAWLEREGNYPECGFLLFDTHHPAFLDLITAMLKYYVSGSVQNLEQTHDSWVWWQVIEKERNLPVTNLSGEYAKFKHPFIHVLGKWMDHLKGPTRKEQGKSHQKDLKIDRPERYWQNL
jgi:hypothetical protein